LIIVRLTPSKGRKDLLPRNCPLDRSTLDLDKGVPGSGGQGKSPLLVEGG